MVIKKGISLINITVNEEEFEQIKESLKLLTGFTHESIYCSSSMEQYPPCPTCEGPQIMVCEWRDGEFFKELRCLHECKIKKEKRKEERGVEMEEPHNEELLEQLYWEWDSERQKGNERISFKGKLRWYAEKFHKEQMEKK